MESKFGSKVHIQSDRCYDNGECKNPHIRPPERHITANASGSGVSINMIRNIGNSLDIGF